MSVIKEHCFEGNMAQFQKWRAHSFKKAYRITIPNFRIICYFPPDEQMLCRRYKNACIVCFVRRSGAG